MDIKKTEDGIFIPKEYLNDFDDFEVIKKHYSIILKSKNLTKKTRGIVKKKVNLKKLHEDYELGLLGMD